MTNTNERIRMLEEALNYVRDMSGSSADKTVYDFLAGALSGYYIAKDQNLQFEPWLYIIGVRGGSRITEVEAMLNSLREAD